MRLGDLACQKAFFWRSGVPVTVSKPPCRLGLGAPSPGAAPCASRAREVRARLTRKCCCGSWLLEGRVLLVSLPVSFLAKGVSGWCERPVLDE